MVLAAATAEQFLVAAADSEYPTDSCVMSSSKSLNTIVLFFSPS